MDVVLITGPGGSGKSTLAQGLADRLGWTGLSEDDRWVANGWGSGMRSEEHERTVQQQVVQDVLAAWRDGRGVVLELILYKLPPNPLTAYQDALTAAGVPHRTVVLAPTVDEILRRMARRGRPTDADVVARRADAEWQLAVIEASVDPTLVLDPTDLTPTQTLTEVLDRLALPTGDAP